MISVEGGDWKKYILTIKTVTEQKNKEQDIESIVVCVSTTDNNGEGIELIRWVHYDVLLRIDNRPSKHVGATGDAENVKKVISFLKL